MKGTIKTLSKNKAFGFIKNIQGVEYFFHKSDFYGHWLDLEEDFFNKKVIEVEFEPESAPKGPRAKNVKRTDGGKIMEIKNDY